MLNSKLVKNAFTFTGINVIGSFLPLIGAIVVAKIYEKKEIPFEHFFSNGEVNIICIPICMSVIFSLYQYKKHVGISKLADFVYLFTFIMLALAIVIYAYGIKYSPIISNEPQAVENSGLASFSTYMLIWTVICMLVSKYVEDENMLSIQKSRNEDQDNLEAKFLKSKG